MLVLTTGGDNYHTARQNLIKKLKPSLVASCNIHPGNGVGLICRMGMDVKAGK